MSPSPLYPCNEEQWVPPHIFLSKCQTPQSPSTSSGFPPILWNIMAIIPIMAQLGTPYSCRYPSISRLSEEMLLLHKHHRQARYRGKPDILPPSLFSIANLANFRKIKWKHLAHAWLDGYPRSSIGRRHLHWPDGILLWHSESQYYYIGKKR